MSARLSPAQRRVVDAMRDGAVLIQSDLFSMPDWTLVLPSGTNRRVHAGTGWALVSSGVVVMGDPQDFLSRSYVLAPAYEGGEA